MTKNQMSKLADLVADRIIEKIKHLQEELDHNFFEKAKEQEHLLTGVNIDPATKDNLHAAHTYLIAQLQENLEQALEQENYDLANVLQKKIEDLQNKNSE